MSRDEMMFSLACASVVVGAWVFANILTALASPPRHTDDDMRRVELTLIDHGYAVDGFAETPAPDLAFLDELAPQGCAPVLRARLLARLAIARRMPDHALYAGDVARAIAAVVALDTGRLQCLGVEP